MAQPEDPSEEETVGKEEKIGEGQERIPATRNSGAEAEHQGHPMDLFHQEMGSSCTGGRSDNNMGNLRQDGSYSQLLHDFINMGSQETVPQQNNLSYMELLTGNISYKDILRSGTDQADNIEAAGFYSEERENIYSGNLEENGDPWDITLFHNIQLDQIETKEAEHGSETTSIHEIDSSKGKETQDQPRVAHDGAEEEHADEQELLTEEDIETFFRNEEGGEQDDSVAREQADMEKQFRPHLNQQFKTREEAHDFFNLYSSIAGFSSSIVASYRTISKKRKNEITRFHMKCHRHGKTESSEREKVVPQRQSTVIARTECKCEMIAAEKGGEGGHWEITRLNLDHNHELLPNSRFFRSHKFMSDAEKDLIRTLKKTNTPTRRIVTILAFIRGGIDRLPYNKKAVSNYGTSINREIENTDMMEVVKIFNKKQAETPGFYYSFELDGENKVRSIFWTDQRSRLMYEECGECVSFDTTFLTNKYNLPFAPFVGVSTHGKTALFGCALIINETADTFRWLFDQFKTAMNGIPPKTIITDQDKGMKEAIKSVFPLAVHRVCLFHVKKKAEEKIGTCFQANEGLYEEFQDIIDNSLTIEEFEALWQEMILKFQVQHIDYFNTLWEKRTRWAPVYFKDKFFPLIQTTARSEGMNALFKQGVGAKFSVTSFLREYQSILDVILDREDECDHKVKTKKVAEDKYWSSLYIERQAHHLYNISIFRRFQWKLRDTTRLQLVEHEKDKVYFVFQAPNYPLKEHRPRTYLVQVDAVEQDYTCVCCRFQKDGILCSHILKVMIHMNVPEIPEKYIIDRWRKKDRKIRSSLTEMQPVHEETPGLRFNMLSKRFVRVASNASRTKKKSEYFLQEMLRIEKAMAEMDDAENETVPLASASTTRTVTHVPSAGESSSSIQLQDPDISNSKGRPRMLTIREAIKKNKFYSCSHCGSTTHTLKNCTNLDREYDLPRRKRKKAQNPRNQKKSATAREKKAKAT